MRRLLITGTAGATLLAPATAAHAQSLAQRIDAAGPNTAVHFEVEPRPGVCGDGENIMVKRDRAGDGMTVIQHGRNDRNVTWYGRVNRDGTIRNCEFGPVTIELTRADGRITDAKVRVGGTMARAGIALGNVAPADAVAYLLTTAVPDSERRAGDDLIFASTLANTESWQGLLTLARNRDITEQHRKAAIFWLGQAAGEKATAGLTSVIGDDSDEMEVRKSAVFALSQIRAPETIDALIDIARTNREPEIRKNAIFWLAQTKDPKAVAFFEEILKG
jgi:hypothetical protein